MLQRRWCGSGMMMLVLIAVVCGGPSFGESYTNYTVGDSLGWYDTLIHPDVDYQKWASGKTFSLGDFLIFNTDNNHSVVQTYNLNSFKSCDYNGDDSSEWSGSDPSSTAVYPVTVPVPLLKEGPTYFFSGDYDGWQCHHGTKLQITVLHGKGLPPSLKSSSTSVAPSPAQADSGDDDSVPDAALPGANFNHPKNITGQGDGGAGDEADDSTDANPSASAHLLLPTFIFLSFSLLLLLV